MSQIIKPSSGGGGSSIETIDGDVGSITGSTVTIFSNQATNNSGGSVQFNNSGTVSTLNLTDANHNTYLGLFSGSSDLMSSENTGVGRGALNLIAGSSENVAIGSGALGSLTGGDGGNVGIGYVAGFLLDTGNDNIFIGNNAGSAYTTTESQNICIGDGGVIGESRVLRLGMQESGPAGQNTCFIAGILGNTVSNTQNVTIDSVSGQLGVGSAPSPSAVAFLAYLSASVPNATGNGADYHVAFDTVPIDTNSAFTPGAAAVFTAPSTGLYFLSAQVNTFLNANAVSDTIVTIVATSRSVLSQFLVGAAFSSALTSNPVSAVIDMTAGDTAYINVNISATGSNTCQINGSGSPYETYFSGFKIA